MVEKVKKTRRFQAAETEVERIPFHPDGAKFNRRGCGTRGCGEAIEDWAARIAKSEKFGDLVVGFAGSVVACLTEFAIAELAGGFSASSLLGADFVENSVAAGDDEADRRKFWHEVRLVGFQKNGVHEAFEMVDGNEGLAQGLGQGFGIRDADK